MSDPQDGGDSPTGLLSRGLEGHDDAAEPVGPTPTPAQSSPLVAAARRIEQERKRTPPPPAAESPADPDPIASDAHASMDVGPVEDGARRVEFSASRRRQILMDVLILVGVVGCAGLAAIAYQTREGLDLALAGAASGLTLVLCAGRARMRSATVVVEHGTLTITRRSSRSTFDLTNVLLDLEQHGSPGERDWTFVVHRRSLGPITIDRSMVDPARFMEAVRPYRRDV